MKNFFRIVFFSGLALPLAAELELHYLARSEAGTLPGVANVNQTALYSGPLNGAHLEVLTETFVDPVTGGDVMFVPGDGDRTFLRGLFMDPATGELAITGLESSVFVSVPRQELRQFELLSGPTITVGFGWPGFLTATGPRKVRVWKKPLGGGVASAWSAALPTPPSLPYDGPPFPSPDVSLTTNVPWLLMRNAIYSFSRDEVIVPMNRSLFRTSPSLPFEDITPNFNRAIDQAGNDDPGVGVQSFLRTVLDDRNGQLYLSFGTRDVGVFELRPAQFYDNPLTVDNPHLIQSQQLRLVDNASPQFLGRINLDGASPILFERRVVAPGFLSKEVLSAVDPVNGFYFAMIEKSSANVTTREMVRKPLNRPDSSVLATFSAGSTGNANFDWTVVATGLPAIVDLEVEPVTQRIYYLRQNGELRSMTYEGNDDRTERQLPGSTSAFAIYHSPVAPAPVEARIQFVEDLPFSTEATSAAAISGDGRTILGTSRSGDETLVSPHTVQINQTILQSLPGRSHGLGAAFPLALSQDGKTALMLDSTGAPVTWAAGTNLVTGAEYGAFWLTAAGGLSGDGSVIAGAFGNEPGRFSLSGGLSTFGFPVGRETSGRANAVSADGTRFAGQASGGEETEAFLYDSTGGYSLLGDLPGGAFESLATAISPDGTIVVGQGVYKTTVDFSDNTTNFTAPFRWTAAEGMLGLGNLEPDSFGQAADVNDQGTTVGTSSGDAFIHHPLTGMISLENFLTNAYGLDLTGIDLLTATGISDDNTVVIGRADHNGTLKGYAVTLPNFPADALVVASPLSALADQDGDGLSDLLEGATGSDPFSARSRKEPFLEVLENGAAREVCFLKPAIAASGRFIYSMEYSQALNSDWSAAPLTVLENSTTKIVVRLPASGGGFVRLVVSNAP